MKDYYAILEVDRKATQTQIRAAYKRQAMIFHPDRNPGDIEAEEQFKMVNEAYHVLSDPLKKENYDAGYDPEFKQNLSEEYWREMNRRRFYAYQNSHYYTYRVDKQYFRVQAIAFVVFLLMSGTCFSIIHTVNYFIDLRQAERWKENSMHLKKVNALFDDGQFREALTMIKGLKKTEPLEFRFTFAQDSLLSELRRRAEQQFEAKNFDRAASYYNILAQEESPVRMETLQKIATCQYYLGAYGESLQALKHLLNQQPWNLELVYQIAVINKDKLQNHQEALHYLTLGKKLFKRNLTDVYGSAFEVVMDPQDVPEIYFYIFDARARTNIRLGHYTEAITDCNWAISLRNSIPETYRLRAEARVLSGRYSGVCEDLSKASQLGLNVTREWNRFCSADQRLK